MNETLILCGTAASLGFMHTLFGPDHYLPFVAMSRVGRWSLRKTILITVLCGFGHVLSSVALGLGGIALGVAVFRLESIEGFRGDLAGWLLVAFGLAYTLWGIKRGLRNRPHTHLHVHDDGTVHAHEHVHEQDHLHIHNPAKPADGSSTATSLTPWILFTIFLFGPCEPLIPMLMYPAAGGHWTDVLLVTTVFGAITIATMTSIVVLACAGVGALHFRYMERFSHAAAGFVILLCGAAIKFGL